MFIGREAELEKLSLLWKKRVSSLVTCRGRRRIGKSSLNIVGHYLEFLPRLQERDRLVLSASPYRKRGRNGEGVQIDLLLQMRSAAYVIEIKRQGRISEDVERQVDEKVRKLVLCGHKSVRTALVYDGDLDPHLVENGYFDVLISSEDLLGWNCVG